MNKNWQTKTIGELCNLMTGGTPSRSKKEYFENGSINWLVSGDINKRIINECENKITELGLENSSAKFLPTNSVLIALNGQGKTRGMVAMLKIKATCNQSLVSIYPKNTDEIIPEYIFYFLESKYEVLRKLTGDTGNDRRGLNMPIIRKLEIPYPPLSEQQRIVKILDEVIDKLDKVKENTQKNLQNAGKFFISYIDRVFTNQSEEWKEDTLNNICEIQYGYTTKAKETGDYRYVRITDTDKNGLLKPDGKLYAESFKEVENYTLVNGDLLMARTGASAGNLLFYESDENSVFASYLIRIRFNAEVSSKLYWYYSKSDYYWRQVKLLTAGAAQPQFNGGALKKIVFKYPKSLTAQQSIINKLDVLSAEIPKIEEVYKNKLFKLEELKQSVLTQAFFGNL